MKTSSVRIPFRPQLLLLPCAVLFLQCAHGANPGADPLGGAPNTDCRMTTTFPDGATLAEPCLMTVLPAGRSSLAPRGSIRFIDSQKRSNVFSLNFFPPKDLKTDVAYTLTIDFKESFLNAIVQQTAPRELCRINKEFPSKATVTFTALGAAGPDFHGTLKALPACYLNLGTPQQKMVPGGQTPGATTTIVF